MLVARGHKSVGEASVRWALAFGRGVWCKMIEEQGVAFDTRFMPPVTHPPKPNACLYLLAQGEWRAYGAHAEHASGPVARALSTEQLEGADGRHVYTFRVTGEPALYIEAHVPASALRDPRPLPHVLELDADAWAFARRAAHLSQNDDAALEASLGELLRRLGSLGVLDRAFVDAALVSTPKPVQRLWRALAPLIERLAVSSTSEDVRLAAGLTMAQVERELRRIFGALGIARPGLRAFTHHLRLKTAVVFLSAEGASIADVAAVAGYGSTEAMGRAFRNADLAAPSAIQRELEAERQR